MQPRNTVSFHQYIDGEQNFLALCASGYYNNCLIHRNIKGFIVQVNQTKKIHKYQYFWENQMGDPTGTGKNGMSIYGKHFPDEFDSSLKVEY